MNIRRWLAAGILSLTMPLTIFAQSQHLHGGRFSFSLTPKVLINGSITDAALGYAYTEKSFGELRLRFSNEAKKQQFNEAVPDSLNAVDEKSIEVFLMPFKYQIIKNPFIEFQAGAGIYYDYSILAEKGYFNMPVLEALGKEKVNSFSNDFSMHMAGPDFEAGFACTANWLTVSVHAGIVPIFYLNTLQKMSIVPLMEPNNADYTQNTSGSPYLYMDIGFIFFKYISFNFLYDFSRLNYKVIDFDDALNWHNPGRTVLSQSLKIEASLLIPLQGSVYTQIGYGHTFDSIRLDSASPAQGSKQYLILSAKVIN
jgi:hypothetical protein